MVLSKEQLLARDDLPTRDVEIGPSETVRIRALSAGEVARWMGATAEGTGEGAILGHMALLAAMSLANEDGSRMFTADEARDFAATRLPVDSVKTIFNAAADLNGLTKESAEAIQGN